MIKPKIAVLYTTVGNEKDAKRLARAVIEKKVAVCANILPKGKSIYVWEGKVEEGEEYYVLFKTKVELLRELEEVVAREHPYEVPAILKWECETSEGFYDYIIKTLS